MLWRMVKNDRNKMEIHGANENQVAVIWGNIDESVQGQIHFGQTPQGVFQDF